LKASWTKGGKERDIPLTTDEQRTLLEQAKDLTGPGSLTPAAMSYRDPLNRFKAQTAKAGIDRVLGLRHGYAQARHAELTGWKAPAAGGPTSKQLSPAQKAIDHQARMTISRELGHEREQITPVCPGRLAHCASMPEGAAPWLTGSQTLTGSVVVGRTAYHCSHEPIYAKPCR
jgi:hypothetical protein